MESTEYPDKGENAYDLDNKVQIGGGGIGTVYKIKHRNTGNYYALKIEDILKDYKLERLE